MKRVLLVILVLAGCGFANSTQVNTPVALLVHDDVGGAARVVWAQKPSVHPTVAVVGFHGWEMTPQDFLTRLRPLTRTGAAVFSPDGFGGWQNMESFNAGGDGHASCCFYATTRQIDDNRFLTNFIAELHSWGYSKIYLVGFSNGGMFVLQYACLHPDLAPVVASMAGTLEASSCPGAGRFRALSINGAQDMGVPAHGPAVNIGGNYLNSVDTLKQRIPTGITYEVPNVGHVWAPTATADMCRYFEISPC